MKQTKGFRTPWCAERTIISKAALLLMTASSAYGQSMVIDNGQTVNIPGDQPNLTNSTLVVGQTSSGTLNIQDNGQISGSITLGVQVGATGTLNVNGTGRLTGGSPTGGQLLVGDHGVGILNITDGGHVDQISALFTSRSSGSSSTVTVDGIGSLLSTTGVNSYNQIGFFGPGTVNIRNGGLYHADTDIEVGAMTVGTMNITNGGRVESRGAVIGNDQNGGGISTVNVTGLDSRWDVSQGFTIGQDGQGALLIDQGTISSQSDSYIGRGGAGTIALQNPGAVWNSAGADIHIAALDSSGDPAIGRLYSIGGGSIAARAITIGEGQGYGFLTIVEGGVVSATGGIVVAAGEIDIGSPLDQPVTSAGTLTTPTVLLGTGGTLLFNHNGNPDGSGLIFQPQIEGSGTLLQLAGDTTITADNSSFTGNTFVDGGVLRVTGKLGDTQATLGFNPGSNGAAKVSGAGANWQSTNTMVIGAQGTGTLIIGDQGKVMVADTVNLGTSSGSVGTLTLTDGGELSAAQLIIAQDTGSTGTLNIGAPSGFVPTAPGVLDPLAIHFGTGTGVINFNHTSPDGAVYVFASPIDGMGAVNAITGTTVMTVPSIYAGPTTIFGPSNLWNAGAILATGAPNVLSPNSDYIVNGGVLDIRRGDQQIKTLTLGGSQAGRLAFSDEAGSGAGQTLTVTGAYTSKSGAWIIMKTVLGDDNSPTDRLVADSVVLDGGPSRISVINQNGVGAATTGDGIKLVQVNGGAAASAAGAFFLGNRVSAGAYDYSLYQNGIGAHSSDGNWYLRSTLEPVDSGTSNPSDPGYPNYRAEVPLYTVMPALASRLGLDMLGTRDERTGSATQPYIDTRTWSRVFGDNGNIRNTADSMQADARDFANYGPSYDVRIEGIQVGSDLLHQNNSDNTVDTIGVYWGAANATSEVDRVYGGHAGSSSISAYSLGGYWTHEGVSGWYVDGVVQATSYGQGKTRSERGETMRTRGRGAIASLEGGYPILLTSNWSMEGQTQLVYQFMDLRGGADHYGLVDYHANETIHARLGSKLSHYFEMSDGSKATMWGGIHLWQTIGSGAKTTISTLDGAYPTTLSTDLGGTRAQFQVGASGNLGKNVRIAVSVEYEQQLAHERGTAVNGMCSLSIIW